MRRRIVPKSGALPYHYGLRRGFQAVPRAPCLGRAGPIIGAPGRAPARHGNPVMRDLDDLEVLVDNGTPLIFVETLDTTRLEDLCRRLGTRSGRPVFRWTLATGLARFDGAPLVGSGVEPAQVLAHVMTMTQAGLFLLLDLARYLGDGLIL